HRRALMPVKSKTAINSAVCAAALSAALIACVASEAEAQPHVNVTQGQPVAGCSGRIDNLKPPVMNWANQNPIDSAKTYILKAARMLEPRRGEIARGGHLVVRGACIVGVNTPAPDPAEVVDLGDVTLLPGLVDLHTHLLLRDEDQTWPYSILWK